jgi:hypothetical protein
MDVSSTLGFKIKHKEELSFAFPQSTLKSEIKRGIDS